MSKTRSDKVERLGVVAVERMVRRQSHTTSMRSVTGRPRLVLVCGITFRTTPSSPSVSSAGRILSERYSSVIPLEMIQDRFPFLISFSNSSTRECFI